MLDFDRIWLHALCGEHSTVESNLRQPYPTLCAVEDVLLQKVLVMLLGVMTIYAYIIMNDNYAQQMVCCLVHLHLKDVLGHLQSEWHMQETIPTMMHIKLGEV